MDYLPAENRYTSMRYNRVGASGVRLPAISLGLWHNFGDVDVFQNGRNIARRAFDLGITHFDLANNYGPSPGSAEETFGALMRKDFHPVPRRDDHLLEGRLSHVAGPVRRVGLAQVPGRELRPVAGAHGPQVRRHLLQPSLRSRRRRWKRPWARSTTSCARAARCTPASPATARSRPRSAAKILRELGTPCLIHQPSYNMFNRWIEDGLIAELEKQKHRLHRVLAAGAGPAHQQVPERHSGRLARREAHLADPDAITPTKVEKVKKLNEIAKARRQSLAQMAVAWTLRHKVVTSSLIGASKVAHVEEAVGALDNLDVLGQRARGHRGCAEVRAGCRSAARLSRSVAVACPVPCRPAHAVDGLAQGMDASRASPGNRSCPPPGSARGRHPWHSPSARSPARRGSRTPAAPARSCRVASRPSSSGMLQSMSTRSN